MRIIPRPDANIRKIDADEAACRLAGLGWREGCHSRNLSAGSLDVVEAGTHRRLVLPQYRLTLQIAVVQMHLIGKLVLPGLRDDLVVDEYLLVQIEAAFLHVGRR